MRWLRQLACAHFSVIILGCIALGAAVALAFGTLEPFFHQQPPQLLPAQPPSPALAIADIQTGGFFQADPVVFCADGKVYMSRAPDGAYMLYDPSKWARGSIQAHACGSRLLDTMQQAAADKVVSCKSVQPMGEWCSAPYTTYAITVNGHIWRHQERQVCTFFTFWGMVFLGGAGGFVGVVFVMIRHAYRRYKLNLPSRPNRHIPSEDI